jgi:threonine/homoserine/homoserine lactone efflux protein
MDLHVYLVYLAACLAVVLVPGPTVTLIVANGIGHGPRAGLGNVLGTQLGLAVFILLLAFGLGPVVAALGAVFDWLRLAGAAYLVWLGWKLWRTPAFDLSAARPALQRPRGGFVLQGFLVTLSNPKTLLFFGAFIPQFIRPAAAMMPTAQLLLLGLTAMACAAVFDTGYALLSARAGRLLRPGRLRLLLRGSGLAMIGGGLWLAFSRTK